MKDSSRGYIYIVRAATVITILLLIALFAFSNRVVTEMHDELMPIANQATVHIIENDWEGAEQDVQKLEHLYSKYAVKLRIILDHEDIDNLESSIQQCLRLAELQSDQIISELEVTKNILNYVKAIETFSWHNLF